MSILLKAMEIKKHLLAQQRNLYPVLESSLLKQRVEEVVGVFLYVFLMRFLSSFIPHVYQCSKDLRSADIFYFSPGACN